MIEIRELPRLPRSMTLEQVEATVQSFGYELCLRALKEPEKRQPIGFAHEN